MSIVFLVIFLFFTDRGFPLMHLAMVSTNGTIWDISLTENSSPSKRYLFKLPQSCTYHGYSDAKGILYFIDGRLRKKLTKYHSSFNKKGHENGVKVGIVRGDESKVCWGTTFICTSIDWGQCYKHSLMFGNLFWLYGNTLTNDQDYDLSTENRK